MYGNPHVFRMFTRVTGLGLISDKTPESDHAGWPQIGFCEPRVPWPQCPKQYDARFIAEITGIKLLECLTWHEKFMEIPVPPKPLDSSELHDFVLLCPVFLPLHAWGTWRSWNVCEISTAHDLSRLLQNGSSPCCQTSAAGHIWSWIWGRVCLFFCTLHYTWKINGPVWFYRPWLNSVAPRINLGS